MDDVVNEQHSKKGQKRPIEVKPNRDLFWEYCLRSEQAARARARLAGVPCTIDRYLIDKLLVDQGWRCAVSGLELEPPRSATEFHRDPFAPSLDRITPALGYVPENVRIVCMMVNVAINEWGLDNLMKLVKAVHGRHQ